MKITFETVIVVIFYLILIGIIGISFYKVLDSPTAFEEYEISNDTKLPSFTLCPNPMKNEHVVSTKTFEETMIAIENAKTNYTIKMSWARPFHKGLVVYHEYYKKSVLFIIHMTRIMFSTCFDRYTLDLSDPNVLEKHFNVSLEDVWHFAPRVLDLEPYPTVICLIWTSPFTGPRPNIWTNLVSS